MSVALVAIPVLAVGAFLDLIAALNIMRHASRRSVTSSFAAPFALHSMFGTKRIKAEVATITILFTRKAIPIHGPFVAAYAFVGAAQIAIIAATDHFATTATNECLVMNFRKMKLSQVFGWGMIITSGGVLIVGFACRLFGIGIFAGCRWLLLICNHRCC